MPAVCAATNFSATATATVAAFAAASDDRILALDTAVATIAFAASILAAASAAISSGGFLGRLADFFFFLTLFGSLEPLVPPSTRGLKLTLGSSRSNHSSKASAQPHARTMADTIHTAS